MLQCLIPGGSFTFLTIFPFYCQQQIMLLWLSSDRPRCLQNVWMQAEFKNSKLSYLLLILEHLQVK